MELADVEVEVQESIILEEARNIVLTIGGLSRLTLFSDQFHNKYKLAAKILFGYRSWGETKQYLYDHFPGEIEPNFNMDTIIFTRQKRKAKSKEKSNEFKMPKLHNFEKALICRMFLHRINDQQMIALMLACHRTTISRILYEWGPRWGEVSGFCIWGKDTKVTGIGKPGAGVDYIGRDTEITEEEDEESIPTEQDEASAAIPEATSSKGITAGYVALIVLPYSPFL